MAASVLVGEQELEEWLADGRVRCPGCGGSLSPWGHARERQMRMLCGMRRVRPRRARCSPCERTHVLLPAWSVPRRRDGAEVIGRALLLKSDGAGHRTIAARLGRPPGTVRGWLRAGERRADALADCGTLWTIALGEHTARPCTRRSPLQQAVESLASAALAWRLRFYEPGRGCPWQVIVGLTGGGLLHGRPARPPGY